MTRRISRVNPGPQGAGRIFDGGAAGLLALGEKAKGQDRVARRPPWRRVNGFAPSRHLLNRVEGVGDDLAHQVADLAQVLAADHGEDDLHRALGSPGRDVGEAEFQLAQAPAKLQAAGRRDDAHQDRAQGEPALDNLADGGSGGKTRRVGDVGHRVRDLFHDLADGQQPDQHLEKTHQRRQPADAARDGNDADGLQADVDDAFLYL